MIGFKYNWFGRCFFIKFVVKVILFLFFFRLFFLKYFFVVSNDFLMILFMKGIGMVVVNVDNENDYVFFCV